MIPKLFKADHAAKGGVVKKFVDAVNKLEKAWNFAEGQNGIVITRGQFDNPVIRFDPDGVTDGYPFKVTANDTTIYVTPGYVYWWDYSSGGSDQRTQLDGSAGTSYSAATTVYIEQDKDANAAPTLHFSTSDIATVIAGATASKYRWVIASVLPGGLVLQEWRGGNIYRLPESGTSGSVPIGTVITVWGDPVDYPAGTALSLPFTSGTWAYANGDTVDGYVTPDSRGKYSVGYDYGDADYDAVGYGTNTNEWRGHKWHGWTENNHLNHAVDHKHEVNLTPIDDLAAAPWPVVGLNQWWAWTADPNSPPQQTNSTTWTSCLAPFTPNPDDGGQGGGRNPGDIKPATTANGDMAQHGGPYNYVEGSYPGDTDNRPPSLVLIPLVRIA